MLTSFTHGVRMIVDTSRIPRIEQDTTSALISDIRGIPD